MASPTMCPSSRGRNPVFYRKLFALEFGLADDIWSEQVGVVGNALHMNASAIFDFSLDRELDGAPQFDRGVIDPGGADVSGEGGAAKSQDKEEGQEEEVEATGSGTFGGPDGGRRRRGPHARHREEEEG